MASKMTLPRAMGLARRAYWAEYARKIRDPHGPGVAWMREDSAQVSAQLAYHCKLREWGFQGPETEIPSQAPVE